MKICWKCKEEIEQTYGNGMCMNCYILCKYVSKVHNEMYNEFDDGELSEKDWDDEYQRRLN